MDEATLNEITVLTAELIRLRTTHNNAGGVPRFASFVAA